MNRARPAVLLLVTTVGLLLVTPPAASGRAEGPSGWGDGDDARAVALLDRATAALQQISYAGTRVVSSWGLGTSTTVVVDVEHVAGQGTLVRSRGGGVDEETAAFLAAGEGDSTQRPSFDSDSLRLLMSSYDVRLGSAGRVAGRSAHQVELSDGARVVARMWIDRRTGLPLRREVFDSGGRLAIESAFIELRVDDDAFIAHLPPSPPDTHDEQVGLSRLPDLQSHGWACPQGVGGLRLVSVERMPSTSALHMSYSDGLSRISVFEQRGDLRADALDGFTSARVGDATVYLRVGMPSYAVWEDAGTVYTVVGDAPMDTITDVVASYPHSDESAPGFWDRVGGGMGRLSAWAAPLV